MDAIFATYISQGKLAPFRYHVWWPNSADPMYNFNPSDVQTKVSYYSVGYVPTFRYDGTLCHDPSSCPGFPDYPSYYASVRQTIDSLAAIPSPIRFNLSQQRILDQVNVSFDVIVEAGATGLGTSQSLYLAVIEENQNFPTGKEWYIFRDFVPSGAGGYALALVAGDSLHFEWSYSTTLAVQPTKLATYLFVQKESGAKKVLNALRQKVANPTDVVAEITPLGFKLDQNRPNPFNPLTAIPFRIERAGDVRLTIFDASGRRVTTLVEEHRAPGSYSETWDGKNADGNPVSSGVYYYRLESVNASETRKMTMVR
jgi:hypothetical protein